MSQIVTIIDLIAHYEAEFCFAMEFLLRQIIVRIAHFILKIVQFLRLRL